MDDAREFLAGLGRQLDHLAGCVEADHRRREALVIGREDHEVADAHRVVVRLPAGVTDPRLLAVGLDEEEVHRDIADRGSVCLAGRELEHDLVVADHSLGDDAILALVKLDGSRGLAAAPVVAELERVDSAATEVGRVVAVPRFTLGIGAALLVARFAVGVEILENERRRVAVGVEAHDRVTARQGMALAVGVAVDRDLRSGSRCLGSRRLCQREGRNDEGDEGPQELV